MRRRVGLVILLVVLAGLVTVARDLAGVSMADKVSVGASDLVLNGMGIRTKAFFKIYVAGLYLTGVRNDPAKILAADEPRQLVMHFLYKEVGKEKLVEGWSDGFKKNSPDKVSALKAQIDQFNALWPDMKAGDRAVLTYVPGTGTSVEIKGQVVGTLKGKEFADALFAIWLGPEPPNADLKKGLLGQ